MDGDDAAAAGGDGLGLPQLISRYAERFTALAGGTHAIGSPLGAWLVLALAASAADGELAATLTDALGADIDVARGLAGQLLGRPHPAVAAAAAAWCRPGLTGLDDWVAGLPSAVESGPIPSRAQADAWVRERTLGLIETFPGDLSDLAVLLASALATRVRWAVPFDAVPAAALGGTWTAGLTRVLRSPRGTRPKDAAHRTSIVDTERAGRVGVHRALGSNLRVYAVVAEDGVAPADVLAAAHELAVNGARPVSLFDLPLGDGPLWTVTEEQAAARGERVDAVLPAWQVESTHDLLADPGLGFGAAGRALQQLAGIDGPIEADQTAVARYTRRGFEAAAVTRLAIPLSATRSSPGLLRTATVRFVHPFAVVAVARARSDDAWRGVPVFAAWVAEPHDVDDLEDDDGDE